MENFWKALELVEEQPEVAVEYRLYYNEDGTVKAYSMENLPGNYIVVDRLTFDQCRNDLLVKDGQIKRITNSASWKLVPGDQEKYACHPKDVSIVVKSDYPDPKYWRVKTTNDAS